MFSYYLFSWVWAFLLIVKLVIIDTVYILQFKLSLAIFGHNLVISNISAIFGKVFTPQFNYYLLRFQSHK